jgi:hypothetical protein
MSRRLVALAWCEFQPRTRLGSRRLPNKLFDHVTQWSRWPGSAPPPSPTIPPDTLAYFTPDDVVELAAAVDQLLGDPAVGRRQAIVPREAAWQRSWDNVAGGYLDVLSAAR